MLRKFFYFILIGLYWLFSVQPVQAKSNELAQLYVRFKNSVPVVLGINSICSGALISSDLILTASHCVNTDRGLKKYIMWPDEVGQYHQVEVVHLDSKNDLALLRLNQVVAAHRIPFKLFAASDELKEGNMVATIGHPTQGKPFQNPHFDLDFTYILSQGVISKVNEETLISDLSLSPGNSGGPLFNHEGKIIGVASRKFLGLGVGDIGLSPSPEILARFIDNYKKQLPTKSLKAYQQGINFFIKAWYSYHSFGVNHPIIDKDIPTFSLGADLKKSFFIEVETDFFQRDYNYLRAALGYNYFIEFSEFSLLKLQVSVDRVSYGILEKKVNSSGYKQVEVLRNLAYSLAIEHSKFPMMLRYTSVGSSGRNEYIFSLNVIGSF